MKKETNPEALPYVIINMAMSADGKIATQNRKVHSFGSKQDIEHLYRLRATVDAVMCGARTVEAEGVTLGIGSEKYKKIRLKNGLKEYHLRIVVSGSASVSPDLPLFESKISPVIVLAGESAPRDKINNLIQSGANVIQCGKENVDFINALKILKNQWNVHRLLCEGGGELNFALFRLGIVKELYLTICPFIFGGGQAPTIADAEGFLRLNDAVKLEPVSKKQIGDELFLHYKVI